MVSGDAATRTPSLLQSKQSRAVSDAIAYSRFPLPLTRSPADPADLQASKLPFSFQGPYSDPAVNAIAPHVDRAFYLLTYPDIAGSGIDPVVHYAVFGWREGRNPNAWFDSNYYLSNCETIGDQGINPFWHYLVAGQFEGREPRAAGNVRRGVLERLIVPSAKPPHDAMPRHAAELDIDALVLVLGKPARSASGMVLSISHDRYFDNIGGTQIFIADEENKFVGNRFLYIHISPAVARLTLSPPGMPERLQVVVDGALLGVTSYEVLAAAIRQIPVHRPENRVFVVHSLLGHDTEGLTSVAKAFGAANSFFWVHDFSSLCEGYNLLRNDIAFCEAPPVSSMACRVCIYGQERALHLRRIRELFDRVRFHVVAPSRSALDIWLRGTDLPHLDARVHAHCRLDSAADEEALPVRPDSAGPARVAFIGQPGFHKGYPFFLEIVARSHGSNNYKFYHFGAVESLAPVYGVTTVPASVTRGNPRAMTQALRQHDIDLVLVLSPWPETFSYVTFEAFAAGADVVAFVDGGNVASAVRSLQRGIVFADETAIFEAFKNGQVAAYVARQREAGKSRALLEYRGTTATIDLERPDREPEQTRDPALRVEAGGQSIDPASVDANTYCFRLPPDCASVRLVSRSVVPAWTTSGIQDTRRLGVRIAAIDLDGKPVSLGDERLADGWYEPEPNLRWTDGNATVMAGGARNLDVTVSSELSYWRTGFCSGEPMRRTMEPVPVGAEPKIDIPVLKGPGGRTSASDRMQPRKSTSAKASPPDIGIARRLKASAITPGDEPSQTANSGH